MIYLCNYCGWRINQREKNEKDNSRIGSIPFMYNHQAFCSEDCVNEGKKNYKKHKVMNESPVSDWNEIGWEIQGNYSNWKIERKNKDYLQSNHL